MTDIKRCNCESPFQDNLYGKNMRLHNVSESGKARCTVCGKEYNNNSKK